MTLLLFEQPDRSVSLQFEPMMNSALGVRPLRLATIPEPKPVTMLTSACSKFCALAFQLDPHRSSVWPQGSSTIGPKIALHVGSARISGELVRREQQVDRVVAAAAVVGRGAALMAERGRDLVAAAAGAHGADVGEIDLREVVDRRAGEIRGANLRDQDRRTDHVAARRRSVVVDRDREQAEFVIVVAVRIPKQVAAKQIGVDVRDRAFQRELRGAVSRQHRDAAAAKVFPRSAGRRSRSC